VHQCHVGGSCLSLAKHKNPCLSGSHHSYWQSTGKIADIKIGFITTSCLPVPAQLRRVTFGWIRNESTLKCCRATAPGWGLTAEDWLAAERVVRVWSSTCDPGVIASSLWWLFCKSQILLFSIFATTPKLYHISKSRVKYVTYSVNFEMGGQMQTGWLMHHINVYFFICAIWRIVPLSAFNWSNHVKSHTKQNTKLLHNSIYISTFFFPASLPLSFQIFFLPFDEHLTRQVLKRHFCNVKLHTVIYILNSPPVYQSKEANDSVQLGLLC